MEWDVIRVTVLPGHRLEVELKDGRSGVFDVKPYLEHGVFRELIDQTYFGRVRIEYGVVGWPNGQDIAPETLIAEMTPSEEPPNITLRRPAGSAVRR